MICLVTHGLAFGNTAQGAKKNKAMSKSMTTRMCTMRTMRTSMSMSNPIALPSPFPLPLPSPDTAAVAVANATTNTSKNWFDSVWLFGSKDTSEEPPPLQLESLSDFWDQVQKGHINHVEMMQNGTRLIHDTHKVLLPPNFDVVTPLMAKGVHLDVVRESVKIDPAFVFDFAILATVIVVSTVMIQRLSGTGNKGKTNSQVKTEQITTTFKDIAGIDEVKHELEEIVDILKDPSRYTFLGAKVPRGVLLEGPPGVGKTLCARAVAGEAKVPFFAVSGSDFVEVWVGVGASRVRDLFQKAKAKAPCILFIDEIDSIASKRTGSGPGEHHERDQTINALLTEMDGFAGNTGVIVMAATNRRDILDDAIMRPGRFDRTISVPLPDQKGRREILEIHTKNKPLYPTLDLTGLGRRTPGFSGADLENLANEAAMSAAREGAILITEDHFEHALEKIIMGPARKGTMMTPSNKMVLAVHEAGHALVGLLLEDYDLVKKVSIIPRGRSGGATYFEPKEDAQLYTREYMEQRIMVALGGRVAEHLVYGLDKVTTGASGDLDLVSQIAYQMVAAYGFNRRLGAVNMPSFADCRARHEHQQDRCQ